jgi:hypothetical protein
MGFKSGMVVGFGVGYVLGSRAGRDRYEELKRYWQTVTGSPKVRQVTARTRETAEEQAKRSLHVVQKGVEKAGTAVRERLQKEEDPTSEVKDRLAGPEASGTTPENRNAPTADQAFGPG